MSLQVSSFSFREKRGQGGGGVRGTNPHQLLIGNTWFAFELRLQSIRILPNSAISNCSQLPNYVLVGNWCKRRKKKILKIIEQRIPLWIVKVHEQGHIRCPWRQRGSGTRSLRKAVTPWLLLPFQACRAVCSCVFSAPNMAVVSMWMMSLTHQNLLI